MMAIHRHRLRDAHSLLLTCKNRTTFNLLNRGKRFFMQDVPRIERYFDSVRVINWNYPKPPFNVQSGDDCPF
jgi:hypothetical protein